jgi:mono/diheme cytochrome c family protein
MKGNGDRNAMGRIVLGIFFGIALAPVVVVAWLWFGSMPVAVADRPLPYERLITGVPLRARIDRELVKIPPLQADEENLVAGARVYRDQCAACHGLPGKPSSIGPHMFPAAPPLWEAHHHGAMTMMGVSDDPPGETYWKVANGIRLTGMPSYMQVLSDIQMWQVSLLLANADKPLPPAAVEILLGQEPPAPAPVALSAPVKK